MNFHQTPSRLALRPLTLALALAFPALAAAQASVADEQAQDPKKIQTLEEVRVTDSAEASGYVSKTTVGGKERLRPREVPQSVSVITSERVRDQGATTVTDALNMATGVMVISNDMHQSQFYSRGYGMNITYDGVPGGNLSGQQQLDMAIYEQVEVLRGPAGVFTGTAGSNFGGTVNLVRKRAKDAFSLEGEVGTGTWRNHKAGVDVTGPLNATGTLRGRAVLSFINRGHSIDRAHTNKQVGYATLDWDVTPQTTLSFAAAYQRDRLRAGQACPHGRTTANCCACRAAPTSRRTGCARAGRTSSTSLTASTALPAAGSSRPGSCTGSVSRSTTTPSPPRAWTAAR